MEAGCFAKQLLKKHLALCHEGGMHAKWHSTLRRIRLLEVEGVERQGLQLPEANDARQHDDGSCQEVCEGSRSHVPRRRDFVAAAFRQPGGSKGHDRDADA